MKYLLVIFFCVVCTADFAQSPADSCRHPNSTFSVRGKVVPWILIGSGINYTIGAEYGFAKRHSIGIDLVYNDYSLPNDSDDSSATKVGPRVFTVARGVFLNYKCYLTPYNSGCYKRTSAFINHDYIPYIGAFGRFGNLDLHYDDGYKTNEVSHDERHYSAGILLGMMIGVFDINIAPYYKQKYIRSATHSYTGPGIDITNTQTSFFGLRLGVNVMFVLKNSRHVLARYYNRSAN
jgi:hypothetical protein